MQLAPPFFLSKQTVKTVPVVEKKETVHPLSHYNVIIERNLFDTQKSKAKPPASIKSETLEHTELDLKLWGTAVGDNVDSYAVIEDGKGGRYNRKQTLHYEGSVIQGATIKKIMDEKIVLTVNGEDQILELEEMITSGRRSRSYRSTPMPSRAHLKYNRTIKRSQIEDAVQNINELMKQVRFTPHEDGIRVSSIKSGSIFKKMGLRSGDVITSIDNQEINSVDNALAFYENLISSSNVSLQLNRRGKETTINYKIR